MTRQPDNLIPAQKNRALPPLGAIYFVVNKIFLYLLCSGHAQGVEPIARLNVSQNQRKFQHIHIQQGNFFGQIVHLAGSDGYFRKSQHRAGFGNGNATQRDRKQNRKKTAVVGRIFSLLLRKDSSI